MTLRLYLCIYHKYSPFLLYEVMRLTFAFSSTQR